MSIPLSPTALLRRWALVLLLPVLAALTGCGAMLAQNPSSPLKPVRAVAVGNESHVMIDGYDVVAYHTLGRHAPGSLQHKSQYQGVTFLFMSAEHKALFDKEPTRYLPQYGGFCANGITYGIPWGGNADNWRLYDGKLYLFGGAGSLAAFELDRAKNIALADKYWREEVSGSNSFVQRTKRLIFRVPHYKSDAQLQQMVREAAARKSS